MIAIVDYGLGNVKAFLNIYKFLNIHAMITREKTELLKADKVILPGVGAFDYAIRQLDKSEVIDTLETLVFIRKTPLLGVCVGMQVLGQRSEEGELPGLGWIDGEVRKFDIDASNQNKRVPHMGWNNIMPAKENMLINGLDQDAHFYFLHSYYFQCHSARDVLAVTDYGEKFTSIVSVGNILGVQFHPEKSHTWGIKLLKNFASM